MVYLDQIFNVAKKSLSEVHDFLNWIEHFLDLTNQIAVFMTNMI